MVATDEIILEARAGGKVGRCGGTSLASAFSVLKFTDPRSKPTSRKFGSSNNLFTDHCPLVIERSAGTDYAWNIVYQGQMYDGIPGVHQTANGAFDPREQSLLAPDLQAIQQGLGADGYNPGRGVLSYLWSEASSAWNSVYESTPLYGAGQALTDIGNGISELSSWANNEINSAPTWLQPVLAPYQVELGAFNSVGNMIGGMGSLLENPISTSANVVMHPIDVAEAAWGGVTGTFSNLFGGNPYQMGQAVGNIAMAVAPSAGEFGDVARVGEVAESTTSGLNILNPDFLPNAATINKVTAFDFFTNSGKDAEEAILHMRGIDFTQPVGVTTLDAGTILEQYIKWGRGTGNYFSMPGANPLELGIGDAVARDATLFQNTEPVTALQSTASNFLYPDQVAVPWTGGGTQFYIPNKGAFIPIK